MPAFPDFRQEIADIESARVSRQQAEMLAMQMDARDAAAISDIGSWHPWMDAGTATALGRSGQTPFSPIVLMASRLKALVNAQAPTGYANWGDVIKTVKTARNDEFIAAAKKGQSAGLGDAVGAYARSAPVQASTSIAENVGGLLPEQVRDAAKQASRAFNTWDNFLPQYVQAGYRTGISNFREKGIVGGLVANANPLSQMATVEQTDLGQTIQQGLGMELEQNVFANSEATGRAAMATGADIAEITGGKLLLTTKEHGDMRPHLPDQGSGFFVGGDVAQARKRAETLASGDPYGNGQTRTIGRDFADVFFEPGSKPFTVLSGLGDAAVVVASAKPGNAMSAERKAAKTFQSAGGLATEGMNPARRILAEMGGIDASRKTYNASMVESYLAGGKGQDLVEHLSGVTEIAKLDKLTGNKLDPSLLKSLADTTDPDEMRQLLRATLGLEIREAPTIGRFSKYGDAISERTPRTLVRLHSAMPSAANMDWQDPRQTLTQATSWLRNSLADEPTFTKRIDEMARAETPAQRMTVFADILSDAAVRMVGDDATPEARAAARKLTTMWHGNNTAWKNYNVDAIGENIPNIDGTVGPHLQSEHLNRYGPVPDPRDMRRSLSALSALYKIPGVVPAETQLEAIQQGWKRVTLARLAYPIRVIGDEQLRMWAGGLDGVFNHPLGAISWMLGGGDGRISRMLDKVGVNGKGEVNVASEVMSTMDEWYAAQGKVSKLMGAPESVSKGAAAMRGRVNTGIYTVFDKDNPEFLTAAAHEIKMMSADPLTAVTARQLLADGIGGNGDVRQAAKDAVWVTMADARKELDASHPEWNLLERTGSDAYVDTLLDRLSTKTGMNRDLLNAVANGGIVDEAGKRLPVFVRNSWKVDDAFKAKLADYMDVFPDKMVGPINVSGKVDDVGTKAAVHRKNVVNALFAHLFTKPDNYLSRSSTYRQYYWKHAIAYAPALDPAHADELIAAAKNANLSKSDLRQLEYFAKQTPTHGRLMSLDQLGDLAKGHALDDTKKLLYDATERSQFFDMTRLIFPFGEAWKELLTIWPKLLLEKPQIATRAGRLLTAARDPDFGDLTGAPEGKGFFYKDDQNREMFGYPGSASMVKHALSFGNALGLGSGSPMSIPLIAPVQGLSMGTDIMPGVGPIVGLPVAAIMDKYFNAPQYDTLHNIMFPYGSPKVSTDLGATAISAFAPAWMKKAFKIGGGLTEEDQRSYNNVVMYVMQQKASSGEFQINGVEGTAAEKQLEMNRLVTESKKTASALWLIRAGAQFAAPSAPEFQWTIEDKSGQRLIMQPLIDDYRKMQQESPKTAVDDFLEKYGDNAFLLMQGKSMSVSAGLPAPTDALNDWIRKNPQVKADLPLVYGFFAPSDPKSGFSSDAYMRQIESGERVPITPESMPRLANDLVAKSLYYKVHDALLEKRAAQGFTTLSATQSAAMRTLNDSLRNEYPGYQDESWDPTPDIKPDEYIRQLQAAVEKPPKGLEADPLTKSIADYLTVRTAVMAASKTRFGNENSFQSSKDASAMRALLVKYGNELAAGEPRFARVYERVFQREMEAGLTADENLGVN